MSVNSAWLWPVIAIVFVLVLVGTGVAIYLKRKRERDQLSSIRSWSSMQQPMETMPQEPYRATGEIL